MRFTEVLLNPTEAQSRFVAEGTGLRAAGWGALLIVACVVPLWCLPWRMFAMALHAQPHSMRQIEFEDQISWIVNAVVPVLALLLALVLLNALRGWRASFAALVFTTGMASLPGMLFACFFIAVSLFHPVPFSLQTVSPLLQHLEIIVTVFLLLASLQLVKASIVGIVGFTRKSAFWIVPAVVVSSSYFYIWLAPVLIDFFD